MRIWSIANELRKMLHGINYVIITFLSCSQWLTVSSNSQVLWKLREYLNQNAYSPRSHCARKHAISFFIFLVHSGHFPHYVNFLCKLRDQIFNDIYQPVAVNSVHSRITLNNMCGRPSPNMDVAPLCRPCALISRGKCSFMHRAFGNQNNKIVIVRAHLEIIDLLISCLYPAVSSERKWTLFLIGLTEYRRTWPRGVFS